MPKARAKKSKAQTALELAKWPLFNLAWPAAVAGVVVAQVVKHRKAKKSAKPEAPQQQPKQPEAPTRPRAKPRRDYRVATDEQAVAEAKQRAQEEAAAAVAAGAAGLQPDDQLEAYNEQEVDALQSAQPSGPGAGGGGKEGGGNFIGMLKSLGYRVVVPSDGSGQVLLVPPGEKLEGEEGADV